MKKIIDFLSAHEWVRILIPIVLFFIIASAEGKAYWLAGVATIFFTFWLLIRLFTTKR